jgi:serine/threonine protein kinase
MGEVYKATDTRLGRTVAVKVLPAQVASDPALRARLEREAKAISSLNHPHICTLYDIGHQDGTDFLVMEYLEGETLAQRLEHGPLRIAQALQTGIEIADALDKAHRQGRQASLRRFSRTRRRNFRRCNRSRRQYSMASWRRVSSNRPTIAGRRQAISVAN